MKTLVLSMISIAATVAAMTACTSEGDPIDNIDNGQPVEIKLNAGVITTKAPITSDNGGLLSEALADIQFVQAADVATNPAWGDVSSVASTAEIATTGNITLATPLYYNVDPTLKSWLIGYFPKATVEPNTSTNKGKLQWKITGCEDILLSAEVSGNKKADERIPAIVFKHQLLQMQFQFTAEDQKAIDTWGTIESIAIKTKKSDVLENLPSTLTCTLASDPTLAWSVPTELTAFAVTGGTAYTDTPITNVNPITLTTTEVLGGYIMVQPLNTKADYVLEITTSKSKAEVPITLGGDTPAAGKAYEVTLTFKASAITATATITSWETVHGGSGTVE